MGVVVWVGVFDWVVWIRSFLRIGRVVRVLQSTLVIVAVDFFDTDDCDQRALGGRGELFGLFCTGSASDGRPD